MTVLSGHYAGGLVIALPGTIRDPAEHPNGRNGILGRVT